MPAPMSLVSGALRQGLPHNSRRCNVLNRHPDRLGDNRSIARDSRRGWICEYLSKVGLHLRAGKKHVTRFPLHAGSCLCNHITRQHRLVIKFAQTCACRAHSQHQRIRFEISSFRTGVREEVAVSTTSAEDASSITTARAFVSAASRSALAGFRLQIRISRISGHTCFSAVICARACTPEPRMPKLPGVDLKWSGAIAANATAETAAVRISVIRRPSITASGSPVARLRSSTIAMWVCNPSASLPGYHVTVLTPLHRRPQPASPRTSRCDHPLRCLREGSFVAADLLARQRNR